MIVNQSNIAALNTAFSAEFQKTLQAREPQIDKIATRISSTSATHQYPIGWMTGTMREWLGDREMQNLVAYIQTVTNLNYEQTIVVSRNHVEDDNIGWITPAIQQMATEGQQHPWRTAIAALMTDGFTEAGFDGQPFFSAAHTWAASGYTDAQDDLTDEVLDLAAVYAAFNYFDGVRGPDGRIVAVEPDVFLASGSLRQTVDALFFTPNDAAGAGNPLYNKFKPENVLVGHGIPAGRWAMLCTNQALRPVVFQERQPLALTALTNVTDENVFMRNEFIWGTSYRGALACIAWWLACGSDGSE